MIMILSPVSPQLVICDGRVVIMKCQSQSLLVRSHLSPLLSPDLLIRAGLELNHRHFSDLSPCEECYH